MIQYRFVSAALLAVAIPAAAAAQTTQQAPTRAAVTAMLDAQFKGADSNGDGTLSAAEVTAAEAKGIQQRIAAMRTRAEAQFAQLDTNKDGQVTKAEFMAQVDANLKGAPNPDGSKLLAQLDSNKDGKLSGAEYRAPLLAQFDAVDTNKDGTISPAESAAAAKR